MPLLLVAAVAVTPMLAAVARVELFKAGLLPQQLALLEQAVLWERLAVYHLTVL
jgi:hypothetical protein